MKGKKESFG